MTKSVLTLIAATDKEKLTSPQISAAEQTLAGKGAKLLGNKWLSQDEACDIFFTGLDLLDADAAARSVMEGHAIDLIVQDAAERQKKLLITDMDSTIITVECIDEIADFAGVKPQVAQITERAMRGEIDFAGALNERVGLLKGLPEPTLQKVYDERVRFMPGARALVATMRAKGAYTVLVSGGFDFFTSRVRQELGFHEDHSNKLAVEGGALTGAVIPPILDKQSKLHSLMVISSRLEIGMGDALAIGDGANDLPMLMAAGLGVAFHAKPVVQQSARARLNHCGLDALLFAQGYGRDEWE